MGGAKEACIDMKKKDRYMFSAVFGYEEGEEISVLFPDLDVATSGETDEDALISARELLGCELFGREEDGEEIPTPTPLEKIPLKSNERAVLVDVYMPAVRMSGVNKSVNRTVTLPAWLNAEALANNINFSQVLQESLRDLLKVSPPSIS